MFIRWQKRIKSRGPSTTLVEDGLVRKDVHWQAVVVKGVRIDGKPKQEYVAALGGFTESSVLRNDVRVQSFLKELHQRLDKLGNVISPKDRDVMILTVHLKMDEIKKRVKTITGEKTPEERRSLLEEYKKGKET